MISSNYARDSSKGLESSLKEDIMNASKEINSRGETDISTRIDYIESKLDVVLNTLLKIECMMRNKRKK